VVGVNRFVESEPSPLVADEGSILMVPADVETEQVARLKEWRATRDAKAATAALKELEQTAREGRNIMPASIACAKAGVTTGEWGAVCREVFGEYRAPTGIARTARRSVEGLDPLRAEVDRISRKLGRRIKFLVGKPGLDGHSNGAEQIAVRARDAGMEVVYGGIRFTPAEIVKTAMEEDVHLIGLSILSGSHVSLVQDVVTRMKNAGLDDIPIVVGGIVPPEDERALKNAGVAAVYTPKNYEINRIMSDLVRIVENVAEKVA
jgi:(2R)-ethylmalonyl-CoA mutase